MSPWECALLEAIAVKVSQRAGTGFLLEVWISWVASVVQCALRLVCRCFPLEIE